MKQLSRETRELLEKYVDILYQWNRKINLTSYTKEEFFSVGLSDCRAIGCLLTALGVTEFADIGTGYGMPGLVLKILFPEMKACLFDASEKKIAFLEYVSKIVGVRVEAYCVKLPSPRWKDRFDTVVSKASMKEKTLLKVVSGFMKPGGRLIYFAGEEPLLAAPGFPVRGRIYYRRVNGTYSNLIVRKKDDHNDC